MRTTPQCSQAIEHAYKAALVFGHPSISSAHLLLGILTVGRGVAKVLCNVGLTREVIEHWLGTQSLPMEETKAIESMIFGSSALAALSRAEQLRDSGGHHEKFIGTDHLLLAISYEDEGVAKVFLDAHHVDRNKMRQLLLARLNNPYPAGVKELMDNIDRHLNEFGE
jgi:ATPases with chaperone activity, ATP-binding subunit